MSIEVRPFRRGDREQLTSLVERSRGGSRARVSISVNRVMSQLKQEAGEFIVDPWVSERVTLVAKRRRRVAAAAHLLRYGTDDRVGACRTRLRSGSEWIPR